MKNAHWLVRAIFFKHASRSLQERVADASFLQAHQNDSLYYDVSFMDQQHMNLCQEASTAMICHFFKRPFSAMDYNPRGALEGVAGVPQGFESSMVASMDVIKETLNTRGPFLLKLTMKYAFAHDVTCFGYIGDYLIYHDPLEGQSRCIAFSDLTEALGRSEFRIACFVDAESKDVLTAKAKVSSVVPVKTFYVHPSYAYFFRLPDKGKIYDPCQAVLAFLEDYAKNEMWLHPFRPYRQEVAAFVQKIRSGDYQSEEKGGTLTPGILTHLVDKELGPLAQVDKGPLEERIGVIKTFMPRR